MKKRFVYICSVKMMFIVAIMAFVMSCRTEDASKISTSLYIPVKEVIFSAEAGEQFITVNCNKEFRVSSSGSWCVASPSKEPTGVRATVTPNETVRERTAKITVICDELIEQITVKQFAMKPSIFVKETDIVIDEIGEHRDFTLEITTNIPVIFVLPSWIREKDGNLPEMGTKTYSFQAVALPVNVAFRTEDLVVKSANVDFDISITIPVEQSQTDLYGTIIGTDGVPVAGVVVSDGFQCVLTDEKGRYQMEKRSKGAKFVFYATPSEYEVNTLEKTVNSAVFYSPLESAVKRYNFTLKKLPTVETEFNLLGIGDPQVNSDATVFRYTAETMNDMKAFVNASARPCYGLVMGDVVWDTPQYLTQMRTLNGSTGMKVFVTIGNHDKTGGDATTPRNADAFCAVFGPLNYSFNRGDVHIVCMDNIRFTNNSDYAAGFEDYQIEWLKQDLSFVPKDKLVIVFYHIPIRNTTPMKNRATFLNILKEFPKVHLMCGHTHYQENFIITNPATIHEHIHAAACGNFWKSTINSDGTPNGYAVYEVNGAELTNWYYKPVKYNKNFQIRLHRGNTKFGGTYGTYSYSILSNRIVANIWNADNSWVIEVYEDGVFAGTPTLSSCIVDAFAAGYHVGILNQPPTNVNATGNGCNNHAYFHTLKNASANVIEFRATDRFGNVYTQSEIITELNSAGGYP